MDRRVSRAFHAFQRKDAGECLERSGRIWSRVALAREARKRLLQLSCRGCCSLDTLEWFSKKAVQKRGRSAERGKETAYNRTEELTRWKTVSSECTYTVGGPLPTGICLREELRLCQTIYEQQARLWRVGIVGRLHLDRRGKDISK